MEEKRHAPQERWTLHKANKAQQSLTRKKALSPRKWNFSPVVSRSEPFALAEWSHGKIPGEHLISHQPQAPKANKSISCALQACVCYRGSPLRIAAETPSWLTGQWGRQDCVRVGPRSCLWTRFLCVLVAAPEPQPLWMWVSLSSWLSPGRPGLLAEECMGVGFLQ